MGYYSCVKNGKRYKISADKARKYKKKWCEKNGVGMHTPHPWEDWEDELVLQHNITDKELGVLLHRSTPAVTKRRHLLKKKNSKVHR